ncbi:hypothetical protein HanPSC8_Chr02g0067061 [Helianthus annuus]|nr:hypothetical protein HanPSC8_Chr02g0067061 [Helianthus annuus]
MLGLHIKPLNFNCFISVVKHFFLITPTKRRTLENPFGRVVIRASRLILTNQHHVKKRTIKLVKRSKKAYI